MSTYLLKQEFSPYAPYLDPPQPTAPGAAANSSAAHGALPPPPANG